MKTSPIHKFGKTDVRLCNRIGACDSLLEKVFYHSRLDEDELLLVLDDIDTCECWHGSTRGMAIPSHVLNNANKIGYNPSANVTRIDPFAWLRKRIPVGDLLEQNKWDAIVYMPRVTAERAKTHTPYFACLLAHEIEHVLIMRENLQFHMCLSWLYEHNCEIFKQAKQPGRKGKKWDFPHEIHCHKKGKTIAVTIDNKNEFVSCLKNLKKIETPEHNKTLDFLIDLNGKPYKKNICSSILRDIKRYYKGVETTVHTVRKNDLDDDFNLIDFIPLHK